ncbi:MAG: GGDEF domain-containing protein, partial [Clostridiales bacterium]|nr:GGDEF domain-containing protein [Clostridiales bacterium]
MRKIATALKKAFPHIPAESRATMHKQAATSNIPWCLCLSIILAAISFFCAARGLLYPVDSVQAPAGRAAMLPSARLRSNVAFHISAFIVSAALACVFGFAFSHRRKKRCGGTGSRSATVHGTAGYGVGVHDISGYGLDADDLGGGLGARSLSDCALEALGRDTPPSAESAQPTVGDSGDSSSSIDSGDFANSGEPAGAGDFGDSADFRAYGNSGDAANSENPGSPFTSRSSGYSEASDASGNSGDSGDSAAGAPTGAAAVSGPASGAADYSTYSAAPSAATAAYSMASPEAAAMPAAAAPAATPSSPAPHEPPGQSSRADSRAAIFAALWLFPLAVAAYTFALLPQLVDGSNFPYLLPIAVTLFNFAVLPTVFAPASVLLCAAANAGFVAMVFYFGGAPALSDIGGAAAIVTAAACALSAVVVSVGRTRASMRIIGLSKRNELLEGAVDMLIRTNDKLQDLSTRDELTGLENRRSFDNQFKAEWAWAVRMNLPIALVSVDIDNFKSYNDNYGHMKGDTCLKKVAECLKNSLARETDFVARVGGEEFMAVAINTSNAGVRFIAERILKNSLAR